MANKYNHLALVRRDDVVELFKNGTIFPLCSIQFNGALTELVNQSDKVREVFKKTPAIEYSINYFLLYCVSDSKMLSKGLKITDLVKIIPLDEDSYRMGLSLVPEVNIEKPMFSAIYGEYLVSAAIQNAAKGVENISSIFGISDLWRSIKKFSKKHLPGIVALIMDETGRLQPSSIWEYMLTYNRNQPYPNDVRGAFLDSMSVVRNFTKGRVDMKDQKTTTLGKTILECEKPTYAKLVKCVKSSADFVTAANKGYKTFWEIAPLYFILLDRLSNASEDGTVIRGQATKEFAESVAKHYDPKSLKPALLMLGITLGQSSTYKLLYAVHKSIFPFLK
jgi:hypothetical protein